MHKRPYGFDIYLVNVKTIMTIAQIVVAFSEKLIFKGPFKYYVIKEVGGLGQKMAIFDYLQYCKSSKRCLAKLIWLFIRNQNLIWQGVV